MWIWCQGNFGDKKFLINQLNNSISDWYIRAVA